MSNSFVYKPRNNSRNQSLSHYFGGIEEEGGGIRGRDLNESGRNSKSYRRGHDEEFNQRENSLVKLDESRNYDIITNSYRIEFNCEVYEYDVSFSPDLDQESEKEARDKLIDILKDNNKLKLCGLFLFFKNISFKFELLFVI